MDTIDPVLLGPEFTWRLLRALEELRETGQTAKKIRENPVYQQYRERGLLHPKPRNTSITETTERFNAVYDQEIRPAYEVAKQFLQDCGMEKHQARYTLSDVVRLRSVADQCVAIVRDEYSRETIGSLFFDSSKALKQSLGLNGDVLKLLGWSRYPQLDRLSEEAIWVSGHPKARLVLLCENQHYLLQWQKAFAQQVELRLAGGSNTRKLAHAPDPGGVFCYCGDWDFAGLRIYRDVYAIHLQNHGRRARLLTPPPTAKRTSVGTGKHRSRWPDDVWEHLSHPDIPLNNLFTDEQRALIEELCRTDSWIEEESVLFNELLDYNRLLIRT